jgi:5'-3' exonuclease
MRAGYARGADRRPAQNDSRCGWDIIPDLLALVGDAADGYPGIPGIGARTAAQLLNRYGPIENFPSNVLGERRDLALLFKNLATLRTDAPLFKTAKTPALAVTIASQNRKFPRAVSNKNPPRRMWLPNRTP